MQKTKKSIAVIGSGFSGLSAAAYSASKGHDVHVFERHSQPGGRARQFSTQAGYIFDMGPSWYWMPDIIEGFFNDFGLKAADFYQLIALDPQFDMVYKSGILALPASYAEMKELFEQVELGAAAQLDQFMEAAKYKYEVGMREFVNKPCHSWMEFASLKVAKSALKLNLLSDFRSYVSSYFSDPRLRTLMEFPIIFLGASPKKIPALYSLMNYGGYALGTWYPKGGFYKLVLAMEQVVKKQGAKFHFNSNVQEISVQEGVAQGLVVNGEFKHFDAIIASCDYHHSESLLPSAYRNYSEEYWANRTFAPSCLIYYLGFKTKIPSLKHHTLFFEHDLDEHIDSIYQHNEWPEQPLFYVCCPSKTDSGVAPKGHENLFLLMPVATGIEDSEPTRERYFQEMIARIEKHTEMKHLESMIDYKKSYCVADFIGDYSAYQGNAYGLANTLSQTAVLKPSIRNKRLSNLFYTGQLTVPGPGVPPSIISGKIVAEEVNKLK